MLLTDLERGGAPLWMARLARGVRAAGVEVHVGCLAQAGPVSAALEREGIPTFACGATRAWRLDALWRLERHLARIRPNVVHAMLTHANVAARLVGRWRGAPVIGSTVTIEVERRWHRWIERATAWMDAAHFVNSQAVAAHVEEAYGVRPERIGLVPASVAPPRAGLERAAVRRELGLGPDDFVVLWVGRLDPVKRVEWLVECARELGEGVRFVLVGDGPERGRLEGLIARWGVGGRVQLLGWHEDVQPYYAAADVFALPSRTEGMPNVVLEAMMAGLPVVASDLPALREIAGEAPQRLALVADEGAAGFAARLRALRAAPHERARLAQAGADWARAHVSEEASVAALLALYRRVVG